MAGSLGEGVGSGGSGTRGIGVGGAGMAGIAWAVKVGMCAN